MNHLTKLLIVPFLLIAGFSFGQDRVYTIVDTHPEFPGGTAAFYKYIRNNVKYPEKALKFGIEGRVFVECVVEVDGEISAVKVIKGIGYGCDAEAERIVNNVPKFIPGFKGRKPVRVRTVFPVTFSMAPDGTLKSARELAEPYRPPARSIAVAVNDPEVEQLALEFGELKELDKNIANATQLIHLNLTGNKLQTLPNEIGALTNLKELFLTFNQLKEVPPAFSQLQSLRMLYLDRNDIAKFPDQLFELEQLEMIDISYTNIVELPLQVADMPNLKFIYARGTVIPIDQIERINEINPTIEILK